MSGDKLRYKIPSMKEIENIKSNGFNVVSTFSGGGGSCLGYRMAGFNVIYANEFVEEAQKTYKANHSNTYLDTRDIRNVDAEDILKITKLKQGELDLFDGSPPCCAFSTAGKRDKGWNKERDYSDGKKQKIEDLFEEYIRLLDGLQPKTFVAENVSGMVKGKAIGYFKYYLQKMKSCGYEVEARLLNAKWLGVPQARERLIFIGVRKDLGMKPVFPKPFRYYYTLGDALKDLPEENEREAEMLREDAKKYAWYKILRKMPKDPPKSLSGAQYANGSYFNLKRESMKAPCSTICQRNGDLSCSGNSHPIEDRKFTIAELKRITSLPDDFILTGTYAQQWERAGRMVPPVMMMNISKTIEREILCKTR